MTKNNFKIPKGNPSIIVKLQKEDDDPRRHRYRCIYFDKNKGDYCKYSHSRCTGSTHCKKYEEKHFKCNNYRFTETYFKTIILNEKSTPLQETKVKYRKEDIVVSNKFGKGIVKDVDKVKGNIIVYFYDYPADPITFSLKDLSLENKNGNGLLNMHRKATAEDNKKIKVKHQANSKK